MPVPLTTPDTLATSKTSPVPRARHRAAVGLGLALLLGACGSSPDVKEVMSGEEAKPAVAASKSAGDAAPAPPSSPIERVMNSPSGKGNPAPALRLPDAETGEPWELAARLDPSGEGGARAALVSFMASDCEPCAAGLSTLRTIEATHPELAVVTVVVDETPEARAAARAAVRAAGIEGPALIADADVVKAWIGNPKAVPRYFAIDRQGRVTGQAHGFGDKVARHLPDQAARALRP